MKNYIIIIFLGMGIRVYVTGVTKPSAKPEVPQVLKAQEIDTRGAQIAKLQKKAEQNIKLLETVSIKHVDNLIQNRYDIPYFFKFNNKNILKNYSSYASFWVDSQKLSIKYKVEVGFNLTNDVVFLDRRFLEGAIGEVLKIIIKSAPGIYSQDEVTEYTVRLYYGKNNTNIGFCTESLGCLIDNELIKITSRD
jgi:hypothetical protein